MTTFKVRDRKDGKAYDCALQCVSLDPYSGEISFRFNVGISNYQGFHSKHCIYNTKEFDAMYKILEEVV